MTCSTVHNESKPTRSAACASSVAGPGSLKRPRLPCVSPNFIDRYLSVAVGSKGAGVAALGGQPDAAGPERRQGPHGHVLLVAVGLEDEGGVAEVADHRGQGFGRAPRGQRGIGPPLRLEVANALLRAVAEGVPDAPAHLPEPGVE